MKIKVKLFNGQVMPEFIDRGDWVDLRSNQDIRMKGPKVENTVSKKGEEHTKVVFENTMIPLGVAMRLPDGFEAHVLPKSSTYKKTKTILSNSQGIIDGVTYKGSIGYNGDDDQWWYNAIALSTCHIDRGMPICQFRIELSQKATVWQKLRWLFSRRIRFVQVDELGKKNRGGFGQTDGELEEIKEKRNKSDKR